MAVTEAMHMAYTINDVVHMPERFQNLKTDEGVKERALRDPIEELDAEDMARFVQATLDRRATEPYIPGKDTPLPDADTQGMLWFALFQIRNAAIAGETRTYLRSSAEIDVEREDFLDLLRQRGFTLTPRAKWPGVMVSWRPEPRD